ncbi:TonB-dependent siderophore receptor [Rivibacter subsaxonicus]|uniref:Iron complex outermembrane receptor protein n=1 Tax=Rivibacter subsaxonicus TaxID=457575 RepID=A0A4V6MEQ9_9BURK|nr:TonB-dependent siderophore receptor [Rivibacter subsaxonicus]RZU02346.1 iron complex outermembrane receptor protein [Rivibacter subsaxonicus]
MNHIDSPRPTRHPVAHAARVLLLGLACGAAAPLLHAQTAAPVEPTTPEVSPATTLERVVVTGSAETATGPVKGYTPKRAASASKTDTPLSETPQAVTIITRDLITDTGATGLQDALNYAAGVRSDAYGLDSRGDWARIRGTDPSEYLDGLQKHISGYYTSNTRTDPYTLERIEVLRGPSGMLFGQGSTGGLINMVSKRPQAESQGEIGLQFGSFNRRQVQGDFTGALTADGQWLYRIVGVGRKSDTQVDYVQDDRALIAPSLTWQPSAATSLTLQALWQKDKRGSTSQFFPWSGTVLPNPNGRIPTERFIGEPGVDHYDSERSSFGWLFEHRVNEQWTVRQNLRYSQNEVDYVSFYGDSFTDPGQFVIDPINQRVLGRFGWFQNNKVRQLSADQNVEARLQTGGIQHQLLFGVDVSRATEDTRGASDSPPYYGGTVPNIDVFDPVYSGYVVPELAQMPKTTLNQTGIYLQDQLRFASNWIGVAGLRHDRVTNKLEGTPDEKSSATTKRLGLLYQAAGWSPYVSYSESFTPVGGVNCAGERFDPQRGKQWELGLKYLPDEAPVALGAAVYDLREKNRLVTDDLNPNCSNQTGETKTTGVELDAKATIASVLDLIANYTYTNIDVALEGLPRHQASLWTKYSFALGSTSGFSAGLGLRWVDAYKDGVAATTPTVPAHTLVDALLAWDSTNWRLALNGTNLGDKVYLASCGARGDCWWGARRSVTMTATYRY